MKLDDVIKNALQDDAVPPVSPLDYEKMWLNVEKVMDQDKRNPFVRCKNRLVSVPKNKLKGYACAAAVLVILVILAPMAIHRASFSAGNVQKPSVPKPAASKNSDVTNATEKNGQYMIVQNDQAELRSRPGENEKVTIKITKGTVVYAQPSQLEQSDGKKWRHVEVSTVDLSKNFNGWVEDKSLATLTSSNSINIKSYLALYRGAEAYDVDSIDKVNKSKLVTMKEDRMVAVKDEKNGLVLVHLADGKQYVVKRDQLSIPEEFYLGNPWMEDSPNIAVARDGVKNEQEAALKLANDYFEKLKGSDTSIRHRITDFKIKKIDHVGKSSTSNGQDCETYEVVFDVKPFSIERFERFGVETCENGWINDYVGYVQVSSGKEHVLNSFQREKPCLKN